MLYHPRNSFLTVTFKDMQYFISIKSQVNFSSFTVISILNSKDLKSIEKDNGNNIHTRKSRRNLSVDIKSKIVVQRGFRLFHINGSARITSAALFWTRKEENS